MSLIRVKFKEQWVSLRGVAFDKDGTLLESYPYWHELWKHKRALISEMAGESIASLWEEEFGAKGGVFDRRGPFTTAPFIEERTLIASLLYRSKKWAWDICREKAQSVYDESNRLLDFEKAVKLRPGALELVHQLKSAGMPVGIVTTDSRDNAEKTLAMVGLPESFWDFFYTSCDGLPPKPAPDMVLSACKDVGCLPEEMAVVGDSIMDAKMAKNAGAIAVSVPEVPEDIAFLKPVADIILSSLHDISLR